MQHSYNYFMLRTSYQRSHLAVNYRACSIDKCREKEHFIEFRSSKRSGNAFPGVVPSDIPPRGWYS